MILTNKNIKDSKEINTSTNSFDKPTYKHCSFYSFCLENTPCKRSIPFLRYILMSRDTDQLHELYSENEM